MTNLMNTKILPIHYTRLEECKKACPQFNLVCHNPPCTSSNRRYPYKEMAIWSYMMADLAEETGFLDVAVYERGWAECWMELYEENKDIVSRDKDK